MTENFLSADDFRAGFATRLRVELAAKDISKTALARLAGVTPPTVWASCSGKGTMTVYTLYKVCSALNISADWLIFGDDGDG